MTDAPKVGYIDAHSNGIFKVSVTTDHRKLANAIGRALLDPAREKRIAIRAAGPECVSITSKAWIIADAQLKARGKSIFCTPTFDVVQGKTGSGEVTVIVFNLVLVSLEKIAMLYER
jgi:stage V sporulation protein SpoVS